MKHHHFLLFLVLLTSHNVFPQETNQRIDSMIMQLNNVAANEKVDVLNELAKEYETLAPDSTLRYANEALRIAKDINYEEGEAEAISKTGRAYMRMGNMDTSLYFQKKALNKFVEINSKEGMAASYLGIGSVHFLKGEYTIALEYFSKAQNLFETINIPEGIQKVYYMTGLAYSRVYNFPKSTLYLGKAIKVAKETGNKLIMANAYDVTATNFANLNEYDNAISFQQKALGIYEDLDIKEGICNTKMNLAVVYTNLEEDDKALDLLHDCIDISNEINNKLVNASCLFNVGRIYIKKGEYDTAQYFTQHALQIHRETNYTAQISSALINLGYIKLQTGNFKEADSYFQEALNISEEIGEYRQISTIYQNLANLYSTTGDFNVALENYKLFKEYNDSVHSIENREKLAELEVVYKTEQKVKENEILQQEVRINEITISQKNRLILIFIIVIAIVILLMSVIYYFYQQKSKAYSILVRENLKSLEIEKKIEKCILDTPLQTSSGSDSDMQDNMLRQKFEKFMVEEKPYLWADVNMEEFCVKLNTNRTYLSKLINNHYNQSFNDLLFEYRIRAARELLSDPSKTHLSVEGIGELAGFKSNATFHKKFKSILNLTPQLFRSKALKRTA